MKRPLFLLPLLALALVAASAGSIWGCASLRPDVGAPDPSAFEIHVHDPWRKPWRVESPDWSAEELSLLRRWTDSLGRGGSFSFVDYAPDMVVSAETFHANFLPDGTLVLNARSADGVNWTQRVRAQTPLDADVARLSRTKIAIARLRRAMTWDAITNAMDALGDELGSIAGGWPFLESCYKIENGAAPFEPTEPESGPEWPSGSDFDDVFLPGVARGADLDGRARAAADPAFLAAFDRFRRELVAAVDTGSRERFEALVDPAWRESMRGGDARPAEFGPRFFAAAIRGRESRFDVPHVKLRPLLPDEEARLLALAPGESNHLDRTFACSAWTWDNGPRVHFCAARDGESFAMAAPPLWRFDPGLIEKACREDGVTGCPSFGTPWRSPAADRFGADLLSALRAGDASPLLDRLCPETDSPAARAHLRRRVALAAGAFAGLPVRIRCRFPDAAWEPNAICATLDSRSPRDWWAAVASPASLHPGLWLAFDAVVETNGVECVLDTFHGVQEPGETIRLLAAPAFPISGDMPTPEEIRQARREADRRLELVSGDVRFRFLGFLASSLSAADGTRPALLVTWNLLLAGRLFPDPETPSGEPGEESPAKSSE